MEGGGDAEALEASKFIDANKDHPFLLNYWAFTGHSPLNAKDSYIEKYRGLMDTLHPQRNPVYAAMMQTLDEAVGTLMDTLKKDGLENNTIVIFSSDNGGLEYWGNEGMSHHEYQDTQGTDNAPLRGGKTQIYEGGVRVPLIVKWPGVVKPGTTTNALGSCVDMYPTLIEMAGQTVPTTQPVDGVSLLPVLKGEKASVKNEIFTYQPQYNINYYPDVEPPRASVIDGDWKLIRFFMDNPDKTDRYELYDLKNNLEEGFDLSHQQPQIRDKLAKDLDAYLTRIHAVLPVLNPAYDPMKLPPPTKAKAAEPLTPVPDGD